MKKLLKKLDEIEKDCIQMKKEKQLTEYGEGELHIIKIIRSHMKKQQRKLRTKSGHAK